MFFILGWLFNAWLLGLFGFDTMFINGVMEVFNLEITKTGYYTIFALFGVVKSSVFSLSGKELKFGKQDKKADVQ